MILTQDLCWYRSPMWYQCSFFKFTIFNTTGVGEHEAMTHCFGVTNWVLCLWLSERRRNTEFLRTVMKLMWICDVWSDPLVAIGICGASSCVVLLSVTVFKTHHLWFAALPGDDGDVQDEESEAGGGGIQPRSRQRSFILFRSREKDVRSPDRGDPPSHRLQGNQTLTEEAVRQHARRQSSSSFVDFLTFN